MNGQQSQSIDSSKTVGCVTQSADVQQTAQGVYQHQEQIQQQEHHQVQQPVHRYDPTNLHLFNHTHAMIPGNVEHDQNWDYFNADQLEENQQFGNNK